MHPCMCSEMNGGPIRVSLQNWVPTLWQVSFPSQGWKVFHAWLGKFSVPLFSDESVVCTCSSRRYTARMCCIRLRLRWNQTADIWWHGGIWKILERGSFLIVFSFSGMFFRCVWTVILLRISTSMRISLFIWFCMVWESNFNSERRKVPKNYGY